MVAAVIILLIASVVVLSAQLYYEKKHLKRIISTLENIRQGHQNRRFRVQSVNRAITNICDQLNLLLEQYRKLNHKAQFLEQSRKKFISNLSHDLQTPLAAMMGYVEALQTDDQLSPEEQARFLHVIRNKGERLSVLFRGFFELSKLEADDHLLKLVQVNLPEKVEDIAAIFYKEFDNQQVELRIDVPFEPIYVWGDPHFIERIFYNLITNAIRYGKAGGVIGIAIRPEQENVWAEVWDCGPGIKEIDLPHIFDRLYTGEASRNASLRGNGLGLAITKHLVEKQNGEIRVASIPDEKTTFAFRLRRCL